MLPDTGIFKDVRYDIMRCWGLTFVSVHLCEISCALELSSIRGDLIMAFRLQYNNPAWDVGLCRSDYLADLLTR